MKRGVVHVVIFYSSGLGLTGLTYLVFGEALGHGPGLYIIIPFLTFIVGVVWTVITLFHYFVEGKTDKRKGIIYANAIVLIMFMSAIFYSRSQGMRERERTTGNDLTEGHWHCAQRGECDFETIDVNDSTVVTDRYVVGNRSQQVYLDLDQQVTVEVQADSNRLTFTYSGTKSDFVRSYLNKCLLQDRYIRSMIDLSLPEVPSALPFEVSSKYTTGDMLIGKLKMGVSEENDILSILYPDSVFIQVNDVLIGFSDIPAYITQLKDVHDSPRANINFHADKSVRWGVLATMVRLINPEDARLTVIHDVVRIKDGDIGLVRR